MRRVLCRDSDAIIYCCDEASAPRVGFCTTHPCRRRAADPLARSAPTGFGHDQRHYHLPPPAEEPTGEGPVCCPSKAAERRLISSTWDATAATGEWESEDNDNKAAEGYRQPDGGFCQRSRH